MGQVKIHVYWVITHITKTVLFKGRINATTLLKNKVILSIALIHQFAIKKLKVINKCYFLT
jgi:hypothetical protein